MTTKGMTNIDNPRLLFNLMNERTDHMINDISDGTKITVAGFVELLNAAGDGSVKQLVKFYDPQGVTYYSGSGGFNSRILQIAELVDGQQFTITVQTGRSKKGFDYKTCTWAE